MIEAVPAGPGEVRLEEDGDEVAVISRPYALSLALLLVRHLGAVRHSQHKALVLDLRTLRAEFIDVADEAGFVGVSADGVPVGALQLGDAEDLALLLVSAYSQTPPGAGPQLVAGPEGVS